MNLDTEKKIKKLSNKIASCFKIKIAIFGLGSVGNYLLSYLINQKDKNISLLIVGRNYQKILQDVNIASTSALIRGEMYSSVSIRTVDFNNISEIANLLDQERPDFVVNTTRAYSGIKYGSISWHNIRAYGIWTPLSIKLIRNIMSAFEKTNCEAIVINTSYSDVVNAWIKSNSISYPDFGSGNLNHLIPRIKIAVREILKLSTYDTIEVILATSHFHDVVISKEGETEGVEPLMSIKVDGKIVRLDNKKIFKKCAIPMPVDQKRNMLNASSNFEIIYGILNALRSKKSITFHSPGAFGEIGGYPVTISGKKDLIYVNENTFSFDQMRIHNQKSIYLDGIELIENGKLAFTSELIKKIKKSFNVDVPREIYFDEIDKIADYITKKIIEPNLA